MPLDTILSANLRNTHKIDENMNFQLSAKDAAGITRHILSNGFWRWNAVAYGPPGIGKVSYIYIYVCVNITFTLAG